MSIFNKFDFGKYFPIIIIVIAIVVFVIPKYFGIPFSKEYFSCKLIGNENVDFSKLPIKYHEDIIIYIDKIRQKLVIGNSNQRGFKKIIYNKGKVETELKSSELKETFSFNRINRELWHYYIREADQSKDKIRYLCESKKN